MVAVNWALLIIGFAVAVTPGMLTQTVNGASVLGVLIALFAAYRIAVAEARVE